MSAKGFQFTKRFWLIYSLAWIPYALTYIVIFITQSTYGVFALLFAMGRNIIPVAILGVGVIWICNRIDWSQHREIWFFPLHLFLSIVFSTIWTSILFLLLTIAASLQTGVWTPVSFLGNALQWQVFTGIMIYA
ncbi:MAG: hypothetical protein HKN25_14190, partial [Pyrinomonadaceae bacterium]|nr:hypothetical protein [Pyrinomonadaceae bacterium]